MIWRILSRTWLRYLGATSELIGAVIFAFLVVAFYGEALPTGDLKESGDVYFYVRSNGIHTDVCLPAENAYTNWHDFIPVRDFGSEVSKDFISMGWGDKGFFMNTPQWEDLTVSTAFSAIALPTPTAMHVTYEAEPEENARCVKVYVTRAEYEKMVHFIKHSFDTHEKKAELIPGKGYTDHDNFYESNRSYHLFRTCNTWTSSVLKAGDVKTAWLAVFPNGVMGHLKRN